MSSAAPFYPIKGYRCWSFCDADCELRRNNGCRRIIPRYDLQPPNEGVDHICDLKYGRRDYDEEKLAYSKLMHKWMVGGRTGQQPTHWRTLVGDKWADVYVWQDVDIRLDSHEYQKLYDPYEMQGFLTSEPRVIQLVHTAIEHQASYSTIRKLQGGLIDIIYRYLSSGKCLHPNLHRARQLVEQSVELISNMLLVCYELYPQDWAPRVIEHCQPSEHWKAYLKEVDQAVADAAKALEPPLPIQLMSKPRVRRIQSVAPVPGEEVVEDGTCRIVEEDVIDERK